MRHLVGPKTPEAIAEAEQKAKEQITELGVLNQGIRGKIEMPVSALTVVAKFPGVVPTHAVLQFADAQKNIRQMAMTETVDAGVFAVRMEDITVDGTHRFFYDKRRSGPCASGHDEEQRHLLRILSRDDVRATVGLNRSTP